MFLKTMPLNLSKPFDPFLERRRLVLRSRIQNQPPLFEQYLDISTGHMTADDNKRLSLSMNAKIPLMVENFAFGWFVYVTEKLDQPDYCERILEFGYSRAFLLVLQWAYELGCYGVRFDRDGEKYEHLQQFGW